MEKIDELVKLKSLLGNVCEYWKPYKGEIFEKFVSIGILINLNEKHVDESELDTFREIKQIFLMRWEKLSPELKEKINYFSQLEIEKIELKN